MTRTCKKLFSLLMCAAMVLSLCAVTAFATASSSVAVQLVGKDGTTTSTLATWTYDSTNKTYLDSTKSNAELSIVKDFTQAANLTGTTGGVSYDYSAIGALPYTGINKKPDPRCLSVTTKGILLENLYDYAQTLAGGIDLRGDTAMYLSDASGFNDQFTYNQYWGLTRYYYPDWYKASSYSADTGTGTAVPGTLAILGYHTTTGGTTAGLISSADDANALRLSLGQQSGGNKTIADSWVATGNNNDAGDVNEGNLSVRGINTIRFTPVYRAITVSGGTASGTEGQSGYQVAVTDGTITTSDNWFKAAKGETVKLTVTPNAGKKVSAITYTPEGGTATTITATGGVYSFTMPDKAVTLSATFEDVASIAVTTPPTWTAYKAGETFDPTGMVVTYTKSDNTTEPVTNYTVSPSTALTVGDTKVTISYTTEGGTVKTAVVPISVYDTTWYGDGTATSYTIRNKAALACFAHIVNGTIKGVTQDSFAGKTVSLTRNIALDAEGKYTSASGTFGSSSYPMTATYYTVNNNAALWTPIGSGTATGNSVLTKTNYFAGTFDGNGNSISGLYTDGTATVQGLFGCVSGTVKNLTISSGCVAAKFLAGGVCAYLNGGTITNCVNKAVVYADGGEKAGTGIENGASRSGAVGGICGNAAGTFSIADCANTGAITCTNTSKGGRTGGILGLVDAGTVTGSVSGCSNTGAINSYQYSGGILGMNASAKVTIDRCYNTGAIYGYSSGSTYIGGIVATSSGDLSNCYNTGDYTISLNSSGGTKAAHAGGIVSDFGGTAVSNCYDIGNFHYAGTATFASSYGAICGSGYGSSSANKLVNCYALDGTVGEDIKNSCVTVKTSAELKGLAATLGNAFADDLAPCINSGYPVLAQQYTAKDVTFSVVPAAGASVEVKSGDTVITPKTGTTYTLKVGSTYLYTVATTNPEYTGTSGSVTVTDSTSEVPIQLLGWTWGTDGHYNTDWLGTHYDTQTDWTISSAADLAAFTHAVNSGKDFSGKTVTLAANVALNAANPAPEHYWMPIGDETHPFSGTFDGTGKAISGISVSSNSSYAGLFGYNLGVIQNLTASGTVTDNGNVDFVGGIAGFNAGTIRGITDSVAVNAPNAFNVGGIAGLNTSGIWVAVTDSGDVTKTVPGATGTIENCINLVPLIGGKKVGGIVGENAGTVNACCNTALINGALDAKNGIGGIVGRNGNNNTATETGIVTNCYNMGAFAHAYKWSGGIVGFQNAKSNVSNCYVTASPTGGNTNNPIVGKNEGAGSNNYALSTLTHSGSAENEIGISKTADAMKTAAFVRTLGSAFNGDAATAINGGYPVLSWQGGRKVFKVTLSSGTGYTAAAMNGYDPYVFAGDEFQFTVTPASGYTLTSVAADNANLKLVSDHYVANGITADTAVTITAATPSSSGGGSSTPATHPISVDAGSTGTVTLSKTAAASGDKVTFSVKVPDGKTISSVSVTDASGKSVAVTKNSDGTYSFTMPNSKISVSATFADQGSTNSFTDVPSDAWYADAVKYVTDKGLMNGTGNNQFSPQRTMTRAMLVETLYRLAGKPSATGKSPFSDVKDGSWCADAVIWANTNGIVLGRSDGTFRPNDNITRQQMAAILYRYAKYKGCDVSVGENTNILSYTDALSISEYAIPAFQWAVGAGVINGTSATTLTPKGPATRAQVAAILMRFCEKLVK